MLPHPAVPNAADVARSCTNKSAAGQLCGTLVTCNSTIATAADVEVALTAGMRQWPDALQM